MIEIVADEETGQFRVVTGQGETLAITATRAAAADIADLLMEAWRDALAAAVARARMRHGAAVIEPR